MKGSLATASRRELDDRDLVVEFQNLGDNVELGMVQRACGAEPLSLLRFAVCGIGSLCHALETNLEHLFTGDDLEVYQDYGDGRFHVRSRYYNDFLYYVILIDQRLSVDEVTARERRKMVFLRRKFLEDLKEGERIFVRKGSDPFRGGNWRLRSGIARRHRRHRRRASPVACIGAVAAPERSFCGTSHIFVM